MDAAINSLMALSRLCFSKGRRHRSYWEYHHVPGRQRLKKCIALLQLAPFSFLGQSVSTPEAH